MKFESILEEVDGFGPFQIFIIVAFCVPRLVLPCHFLLNNFIAAAPPHHCDLSTLDDGGLFSNLTQEQKLVIGIPLREDGSPKPCEMFAEPQFQLLSNVSNGTHMPTVQCQSGWVYDNTTFTSTMATEWDLVCSRKGMSKATSSIFFAGVMVGAVSFGALCDKFGRKYTLLASYIISVVFSYSSAFAKSYLLFAAWRFLTGFGLAGISLICLVLSIEWVDVEHRAFIGVIGSMAWAVGNMLLAAFAYLVNDWRMLIMTVSAPLGLAVLTWWWIPESARWLLVNGKVERAEFYLDKCAQFNKRPKLSSKLKIEALSNTEIMENSNKSYSYLDLIKTPKMRQLTLLSGFVWYGVASTYYGISLNIGGFGLNIYLTHFIYAAIELPAKLLIYFCVNTIGRRKYFWLARTIVATLGKGLSEASFTTLFLYTTELFPTVVRQNAMGYTSCTSRLGISIAPLVLMLDDVWKFLPDVIICSVAITAGLVSLCLPETLNVRLPETIEDIEHPRRNDISSFSIENTDVIVGLQSTKDIKQ